MGPLIVAYMGHGVGDGVGEREALDFEGVGETLDLALVPLRRKILFKNAILIFEGKRREYL